ncbi:MAG: HD-GYP domain-containing protein [Anaerolineae bacterium]
MRATFFAVLLATGALTLLLASTAQGNTHALTHGEILLALAFTLLIALARRFPLNVVSKTNVIVDASLIFTAVLLFPMPWGPLVAGLGTLVGLALIGLPLADTIIKTSVIILEVLSAQWVYLWLGGTSPPRFDSPSVVVPLLWAGYAMLVVDRFLAAVTQPQKADHVPVFMSSRTRSLKEHVALLLLGIHAALLVQVDPLRFLLAMPPIGLIYLAARNRLQRELEMMTHDAVESLADLIDRRDPYTAGHSMRVAELAERLAMEMGLSWTEIQTIRAAGRVHDLGKMEVDASILTKPGQLTDEEWEFIRRHPASGAEIVSSFPEFTHAADYVRYHHERWDGSGYPHGLRGEEIPLGARIIAVADAFDAMTSDRPYRKALSLDIVLEEFKREAGCQWNEQVVAALIRVLRQDRLQSGTVGMLGTAMA